MEATGARVYHKLLGLRWIEETILAAQATVFGADGLVGYEAGI